MNVQRYFTGWHRAFRAYRMARVKKHGGGKAPIWIAMRIAAADRFIMDGQFRKPMRLPYYLRMSPFWKAGEKL